MTKGYFTAVFYQKAYSTPGSGLLCCHCIGMHVEAVWMSWGAGQGFRRLQNLQVDRERGPSFLLFYFLLGKRILFCAGGCCRCSSARL